MNYNAYELLGLLSSATREEVEARYYELRKKYLNDRFLPGEEGELAAEKLQEIEMAYRDIISEIDERERADFNAKAQSESEKTYKESSSAGSSSDFGEIERLVSENKLDEAQQLLDNSENRNAEWHYIQSILYYKRSWFLESKKQLEFACQMDPDNERYKTSLEKLTKILASNTISPDQMRTTSRPTGGGIGAGNGTCTGSSCGDCLLCNACCNCASCMSGC